MLMCSEVLECFQDIRPCVDAGTPIPMESCVVTNGCNDRVYSRLPRFIQRGCVVLPPDAAVCLPGCLQTCLESFNDAVLFPRHAAMGVVGLTLWWALAEAGFTPRPPTSSVSASTWTAQSSPSDTPTHTTFLNAVNSRSASSSSPPPGVAPWSFRVAYNDVEAEREFRAVSMSGIEVEVALTAHGVPPPSASADTRWVRASSVRDVLAPATEASRLASLVASITCNVPSSSAVARTTTPRWLPLSSKDTILTADAFDAVAVVYVAVDARTDELRVRSAPDLATWHYWGNDACSETDPEWRIREHYPWVDAFIVAADEYIKACGLQEWVRVVGTPTGAAVDVRELPMGSSRAYALRPLGPGVDNPLVVSSVEVAELGVALSERGVRVNEEDGAPSVLLSDLVFGCRVSFPILTRDPVLQSPRGVLSAMGHGRAAGTCVDRHGKFLPALLNNAVFGNTVALSALTTAIARRSTADISSVLGYSMPERGSSSDGEWEILREGVFFPALFRFSSSSSSAMPVVHPWSNKTPVCIERVVRALATRFPRTVGRLVRQLKDQERVEFGDAGTGVDPSAAFDTINASRRASGLPAFTREEGAALAFAMFPTSELSSCGCGAAAESTCRYVTIQAPPSSRLARRRRDDDGDGSCCVVGRSGGAKGKPAVVATTTTRATAAASSYTTLGSMSDQDLLGADVSGWADAFLRGSSSGDDDDDDDESSDDDDDEAFLRQIEAEARENHKIPDYFPIKRPALSVPSTKKRCVDDVPPVDEVVVLIKTIPSPGQRPLKRVCVGTGV